MRRIIIIIIILTPMLIIAQNRQNENDSLVQLDEMNEEPVLTQRDIDMILSQNITPSPNASGFNKIQDLSINEYTGSFGTAISLFNLSSYGIEMPISISYKTSGVQINSVPSNLGLGWSLNAGGVINRTVKGLCDEMAYETIALEPTSFAGYQQLNYTGPTDEKDYLPDEFTINVAGRISGDFFFNKNRDVFMTTNKGYIINEYRYPDDIQETYRDFISSFKIIDNEGVQYFFNENHNEKMQFKYVALNNIFGNSNKYTFSFFLSEIFNANNLRAYTIEYENYSGLMYNNLNNKDYYFNISANDDCSKCNDYISRTSPKNPSHTGQSSPFKKIIKGQRIKRIDFQDGYLVFNYEQNRLDVQGDVALTSIELFNKSEQLIKGYKFFYDYFISEGGTVEYLNYRLKLIGIQEYGNDNEKKPPYIFNYNTTVLSPRNSYQYDAWGYNKGSINDSPYTIMYYYPDMLGQYFVPFSLSQYSGSEVVLSRENSNDRSANNNAIAGALERITYPTGGYQEIEYELNQFLFYGSEYSGAGIRVKSISNFIENDLQKQTIYTYMDENTGLSSGLISLIPQYGYSCSGFTSDDIVFTSFNNNTPTYKHEADIGYSSVKKVIYNSDASDFNGEKINYYISVMDSPNEDVTYDLWDGMNDCPSFEWPTDDVSWNEYPFVSDYSNEMLRGKLKKSVLKDTESNILKETVFQYDYNIIDRLTIIEKRKYFEFGQPGTYNWYVFNASYSLSSVDLNEKTIISNRLFYNNNISETSKYLFDDKANLSNFTKTSENGTKNVQLEYKYPYDYNYLDFTTGSNDIVDGFYLLNLKNILKTPIESIKRINNGDAWKVIEGELQVPLAISDEIVSFDRISYLQAVAPINNESFSFSSLNTSGELEAHSDYSEIILFNKYDLETGQLLELQKTNDIAIVIIWGYNKQYPIAKITNTTFNEVMNAIDVSDYDALQLILDQSELKQLFQDLRNHNSMSNSQITSYTYSPLNGIKTITDINGLTTNYDYDNFNRLYKISDKEGFIKQYMEYHYKDFEELQMPELFLDDSSNKINNKQPTH